MARDFNELWNKLSPERRERIDDMAREMIEPTINDQNEYRDAVRRLADANTRMAQRKVELEEMGLSPDEVKRVLDPMRSFYFQLQEEIERFEERG